jgi:site-specific DNA-methyltransferase (adenine-specific)
VETNTLYYGDNLKILRDQIPDESVDFIYLDPPFNSQQDYNVIFRETDAGTGEDTAQIHAFEDTWHWGPEAEATLRYLTTSDEHGGRIPDDVSALMDALVRGVGRNDMMAYLVMMAPRLVELKRVLKENGSLYLHCDSVASHYLKVVLDSIFTPLGYRNEIIWKRTSGHSDASRYGRVHDVLLYYAKGDHPSWNQLYQPYEQAYIDQYYRYKDKDGRRFMSGDAGAAGLTGGGYEYEWKGITRIWRVPVETMTRLDAENRIFYTKNGIPRIKRYLDESKGLPIQDVWTDIEALRSWHAEKLGYPTQKPEALLERIIEASSNEGDVVLDPFCGCGTAIVAAEKLKRKWVGIDITHLAIAVMRARLKDTFGITKVPVIGEPLDLAGARALAAEETDGRYQFQWWALSLIDARPIGGEKKKGADKGIDGIITFRDQHDMKRILVSVKSGHVSREHVAALRGTVEREKAAMGIFITLEDTTKPMRDEAVAAGFYHSDLWGKDYPKIQLVTIRELMMDRKPEVPPSASAGFERAERHKPKGPEQPKLMIVPEVAPHDEIAAEIEREIEEAEEQLAEDPLFGQETPAEPMTFREAVALRKKLKAAPKKSK